MAHGLTALGDFSCRATAIDLGSAMMRMYVEGRGIVASEPSAIARADDTGRMLATGTSALALAHRECGVRLIHPIRNGVPAETGETEDLLRYLLRTHHRRRYMSKPRMAVTVPSVINQVQLGAVRTAAFAAGARQLTLIPTPIAAAAGAGLPSHGEDVAIVADIGAHVTDVGVVLSGELLTGHIALVGGSTMDEAIAAYVRREYGLIIAPLAAETVKLAVGTATVPREDRRTLVHGKDRDTDLPRTVEVSSADIHAAISTSLDAIVRAVRTAVAAAPPEMAGHFFSSGITLTGGGARLAGLDELIRTGTGLRARVAENAAEATVRGAASLLRPIKGFESNRLPPLGHRRRALARH
ncbi:rod shape-determining protein [Actinomadura sp. 9N407]|uniref:rod shape-determining protein n=1 Tax=Actinomadura sp. 9N407 TaxID=3375154 RepID=UPI00378FCB99